MTDTIAVLLASLALSIPPDAPQDARSAEQEKVFTLLDKFDRLDTAKLTFVRVATGASVSYDSEPPQNTYRQGFLLSEDKERFTVRYLDLTQRTLKRTAEGTPEHERVGHTAEDLAAYANRFAGSLEDAAAEGDRRLGYYLSPDLVMHPRAGALVLARACARRGLRSEVQALWKAAGPTSESVDELAEGLDHHLELDFADPGLTRDQLLERHRQWLAAFPEHRWRKYAEARVTILERMLQEDRARTPAGKPEKAQVIADLIFALRDEFHPVREALVDGWYVDTSVSKAMDGSRPSDRLRKVGLDAASALIEAVPDESFTRCVWYSSRYGGSFRVVPVGTFAERILEEVGGVEFYGKTEERQAGWSAWWKLMSEKGEEAALAELAGKGDHTAEKAAERLLERWPNRVGDVLRGIRQAESRWVRRRLVTLASKVMDERVTAFLLEELERGPYVPARVDAASALLERGRKEGLHRFIKEWRTVADPNQRPEPGVPAAVAEFDLSIARNEAREAMAAFLLRAGDLEAVRVVARDLRDQPTPVRTAVIESLRGNDLADFLGRADPAIRAEVEKAMEGILTGLLDDGHRHYGSFGFSHRGRGVSLRDPRNADLAACCLASFWPDRYDFDPIGPTRLRERRLAHLKNVWRQRQGLPLIELPAQPDVRSREPGIRLILERIASNPHRGSQLDEMSRLEDAGLGALPWVEETLRGLPANNPARRDLEHFARNLANLVRVATLDSGSWKAPAELRAKLAELEGRPLNPERLIRLVVTGINALPEGTGEVALLADRLGDGTGITLELRVIPAPGDRGTSVASSFAVMADDRTIDWSSGSGVRHVYDDREDYAEHRKPFRTALAVPHDKTFEIRVRLEVR